GVSGTTWNQLMWAAPFILIALVIIISMSKQLTILNLGETLAKGLGQNVAFTRAMTLILSMIMAGIAVAMVGQIAFVGLMVPHIV
ncbi:iron chelate uptake ABC transporter family permease subunit, partial [Staphylococcus lugdunensis]|uniref:iron chelate uptake ABC transporter family permease subunit n=1 Tax=Staphylococcus lugdunensis TaxID=28035 RepID=UPI0030C2760B